MPLIYTMSLCLFQINVWCTFLPRPVDCGCIISTIRRGHAILMYAATELASNWWTEHCSCEVLCVQPKSNFLYQWVLSHSLSFFVWLSESNHVIYESISPEKSAFTPLMILDSKALGPDSLHWNYFTRNIDTSEV